MRLCALCCLLVVKLKRKLRVGSLVADYGFIELLFYYDQSRPFSDYLLVEVAVIFCDVGDLYLNLIAVLVMGLVTANE